MVGGVGVDVTFAGFVYFDVETLVWVDLGVAASTHGLLELNCVNFRDGALLFVTEKGWDLGGTLMLDCWPYLVLAMVDYCFCWAMTGFMGASTAIGGFSFGSSGYSRTTLDN